ncbi:Transposase, IS4 family [Streptococcus troglodytae]|uniref:Transposase, IS4 family n=1 Tax=Streptococcus troglodytae TaxID=1111760 RepID=A0A1L7LGM9_9STRE|nr:Transposase, IS4 family [Streptococcus troglodytae]
MCRLFIGDTVLEKLAFIVELRYLVPLLKLIHQWMSKQFFHDDTAIIDSFPLPLCLPAGNGEAKALKEQADISYKPSKKM